MSRREREGESSLENFGIDCCGVVRLRLSVIILVRRGGRGGGGSLISTLDFCQRGMIESVHTTIIFLVEADGGLHRVPPYVAVERSSLWVVR